MSIFFIDETHKKRIFCVGGIVYNNEDLKLIEEKFIILKREKFKIPENSPIKYNLSEDKEIYRKNLEILKKNGYTSKFKTAQEIFNIINGFNVKYIIAILQDKRIGKGKKDWELYKWGFKFLLQRFYYFLKNLSSSGINQVIIDFPPQAEKKTFYHKVYSDFYYNGDVYRVLEIEEKNRKNIFKFVKKWEIPPLKNVNFFNTLLESHSDYCPFLQISDFLVGFMLDWIQIHYNDQKARMNECDSICRMLLPKFLTYKSKILGAGLVIHPRNTQIAKQFEEWINITKIPF